MLETKSEPDCHRQTLNQTPVRKGQTKSDLPKAEAQRDGSRPMVSAKAADGPQSLGGLGEYSKVRLRHDSVPETFARFTIFSIDRRKGFGARNRTK